MTKTQPISWQAEEYIVREHNAGWYIGLFIVGAGLIALSIWLKWWTFLILVVLSIITILISNLRPPRKIQYTLNSDGLKEGDRLHKYEEFKAAGCEIYSVSTDTHFVHKAWHDASDRIKKIQYPMLADPTHAISKDFEVLIEADGLAERGSFIVNPEGKIVSYEVSAGNVGRNADELFRKLQACQFVHEHGDEVCPAKWQPGAETLKPSLDLVGML